MAKSLDRALSRISASEASVAIRHGRVTALFQPIEALQTGTCRGFEALARLPHDGGLVAPNTFLSALSQDDRLCLFGAMLGESIALLQRGSELLKDLYVSINVEVSLLVSDEFVDVLQYFLERYDFKGERLVLEILENEDVVDFSRVLATLAGIRRLGLSIALDDIGSGYASLTKIRDLTIDIVKLDRSFSRDLEMHPEDLMFVQSILSLTSGIGKRMIVEGIETPEVYDALRVMGVELGQGYAIAPPMPAEDVETWLAGRVIRTADQSPLCLLGAYASHLAVVEACRVLRRQPLPMAWTPDASDHETCVIGCLFGRRGWHKTAFGEAHRQFHAVLPLFDKDETRWMAAANTFRDTMAAAISGSSRDMRCDVVPMPETRSARKPAATVAPQTVKRRAASG
jgi:EAL domain-containing protein (putative c-di-GMP-specific phosphodiesterase class I)